MEQVKVKVYCGCYVGSPKWQKGLDWSYEPDECGYEGDTFLNKEDWNEGFAQYKCPQCGSELYQSDDHFELVTKEGGIMK